MIRLFIFIFLISSSFCQAQVQYAAFAGPQATSANYKVGGMKQPAQFKFGLMAGGGIKIPFEEPLYFFPSFYYSLKGYKVTLNNPAFPPTEFAKNNNVTVHTIELAPLFHIDLSKRPDHFFIRFGPAVDFAISGTEKYDTVGASGMTAFIQRPMAFSFGDYGRITAQGILHLGYETKNGLMMFAFYEHGVGSMNNADDGPKILHRIYGLSVGKMFRTNR